MMEIAKSGNQPTRQEPLSIRREMLVVEKTMTFERFSSFYKDLLDEDIKCFTSLQTLGSAETQLKVCMLKS